MFKILEGRISRQRRESWLVLSGSIALAFVPVVLAHRISPQSGLLSLVVVLPLGGSLIWIAVRSLRAELHNSKTLVQQLLLDLVDPKLAGGDDSTQAETEAVAETQTRLYPKDLLDCIMASAAETVMVVDSEGRICLANRAARRVFGLPDSGARGRAWDSGCHLFRRDTHMPYAQGERPLDRALLGEVVDFDVFRVVSADRPEGAWVSCNARPLEHSENGQGAIMIARDITSLVKAEEQLLSNEQRLHGLIDRLMAIVWTTDRDLRLTSVRGNGLFHIHKRPEDLLNKTIYEIFQVTDPSFRPIAQQLRALDGSASSYEWHWKGRDYTVSVEPLTGPGKGITGSIGIALDVTEERNTSRQMAIAQQIQQRLFPSTDPSPDGYQIGGWTFPAEFAAGDYFDYMKIKDGNLGIVVADVSGHGVGPAMLMAETRAYLRALARVEDRVETILSRANQFLYSDTDPDKFVTLYLGKLDTDRRRYRYASAGHAPAFLLDSNGRVKTRMESTTTPLGLFEDMVDSFSHVVDLEVGDMIVILTDGVTDATTNERDFFGEERALEVIRQHRHEKPRLIVESLHRAVQDFLNGQAQDDDITALVVKVTPRGSELEHASL